DRTPHPQKKAIAFFILKKSDRTPHPLKARSHSSLIGFFPNKIGSLRRNFRIGSLTQNIVAD
ncbi:MAG: hypothetical protein WBV73_02915, partial [Phormidium sp.]